jgi:hypothetical protein
MDIPSITAPLSIVFLILFFFILKATTTETIKMKTIGMYLDKNQENKFDFSK